VFKELESKSSDNNILDTGQRHRWPRTSITASDRLGSRHAPRAHVSAFVSLLQPGETQALVVATLGTGEDSSGSTRCRAQYKESFLLHYISLPIRG